MGFTGRLLTRQPEVFVFLGVLAVGAGAIAVFEDPRSPHFDGTRYLEMAVDPGARVDAPYVTRVLGPLLVWALPVDERTGFRILTALSFAVAAAVLYRLLIEWTGCWRRAAGGVGVFLGAATTPNIRDPFIIDAFSYCFIIAGLILAARGRWWWLLVVVPLGLLARDAIVVLLAPALFLYAVWHRRARLPLAVVAGTAATVWILLNETSLVLGFTPPQLNQFSRENIDSVLDYERQMGALPNVVFRSVAFSFGAVWLAAFLAAASIRRYQWACAAAASGIVAVLLTPFVTDWTRALGYAFPLIVAALVLLPRADRLRATWTLALCLAVANYGVQTMSGGVTKQVLQVAFLAAEAAILVALWRPGGLQALAPGPRFSASPH